MTHHTDELGAVLESQSVAIRRCSTHPFQPASTTVLQYAELSYKITAAVFVLWSSGEDEVL